MDRLFSKIALIGYMMLFSWSCFVFFHSRIYKEFLGQVLGTYLLYNLLFHLFYGTNETFIFTPNFTFALLILLASSFEKKRWSYVVLPFLTILVALVFIVNYGFMSELTQTR